MSTQGVIVVGADHRGFHLKEKVKQTLVAEGYTVLDVGAQKMTRTDDYTTYARAAARKITKNPAARGILFCGSGIGMSIAANKMHGVRAGLAATPAQAKAGRVDDHMNILVVAADTTTHAQAKRIVAAFLATTPSAASRHLRRVRTLNRYGSRA